MAFHLGYVADSDEEGQPTPKKRPRDETQANDVNLESSRKGEGPPKRRQTLLAFASKVSRCLTPEVSEPPAAPAPAAPAPAPAAEGSDGTDASETERFVGYTLRDLRRVVTASLRRYGHLLRLEELQALRAFEALSLPAQQLYARLLSRKWPQWVSYQGLGARYKELGEVAAKEAAAELASPTLGESTASGDGEWGPLLDALKAAGPGPTGDQGPWLLDSAAETAGSLLQRTLSQRNCQEDNYGKLLLSALPVAELRRMTRGLGSGSGDAGDAKVRGKGGLVEKLCAAARKQRLLQTKQKPEEAVEALVSQAMRLGRWLCCADSWGRRALVLLGELFRTETCGAAEVSFVLFTTKWPEFSFQEARPLFADRESLDNFLAARAMVAGEDFQRQTLESAESDASMAEEGLRQASATANDFEAAKLRDPFRRRFTAAWCYAEALHHAVTNSPAVGHDPELQAAKIRRLELLLSTKLCTSKRGRWYAELAKEVSRTKGVAVAMEIAAQGLTEGMDMARPPATVDLTSEMASSQEVSDESKEDHFRPLPRDARWDLSRRCRTLAKAAAQRKAKNAWRLRLRKTQAAQTDGDGQWLSELVSRLIEEEENATGPIRNLTATKLGLPQVAPAESNGSGAGRRRMFDGFRLEELTVEELAMQHYLGDGGNFQCGIHCEGAVLRDLFGLLLFDQMFHCSVEGAFVSAFQDAPLDLGTEAFYPSRSTAIEKRLGELSAMAPSTLAEEVRQRFRRLHGQRIRGIRWDRYDAEGQFLQSPKEASPGEKGTESESSNEDASKVGNGRRVLWTNAGIEVAGEDRQLAAAAGAIGGRALAAALRLLCEDYNSAGLPDLLLWSWHLTSAPRARFVEVKSERDTLARRQRLWLSTLRGSGAEAEVCHVRDNPVEERFQSKLRRRKRAASDGSSEGF